MNVCVPFSSFSFWNFYLILFSFLMYMAFSLKQHINSLVTYLVGTSPFSIRFNLGNYKPLLGVRSFWLYHKRTLNENGFTTRLTIDFTCLFASLRWSSSGFVFSLSFSCSFLCSLQWIWLILDWMHQIATVNISF